MFECNLPLNPADYVLPVYKIDGWTAIKRLISGNVGEILVLHTCYSSRNAANYMFYCNLHLIGQSLEKSSHFDAHKD